MNKAPEKLKNTVAAAYNRGAKALGDTNPDFISAVTDLTKDGVARLNSEMAPMQSQFDGIYTQSFGSKLNHATSGKFPLNMSYHFVKHFDGFNDGLVGEESFQWALPHEESSLPATYPTYNLFRQSLWGNKHIYLLFQSENLSDGYSKH